MYIGLLVVLFAIGSPTVLYERAKKKVDLRKGVVIKNNGMEVKVIK